tara:strand:- start:61 stop:507 length:447 start_codon:yes stop_codon:yes gene_type:complete
MADVINKTTLRFLQSVNTPEYPEPDWVVNPDMRAVAGVSPRYWKWDTGSGRPEPMTAAEQVALDLQAVEDARDAIVAQIDRQENILRAVMSAVIGEMNNHSDKTNLILAEIAQATSLADFKTRMGTISELPQRTLAQLRTVVRNALGT